jgi:hypothetical protein
MKHTRRLFCILLVALTGTAVLPAADFSIPELELITRGNWNGSSVVLTTRGRSEFLVSGGYKFGGSLFFGFESGDLSYSGDQPPDRDDYAGDSAYIADLSDYLGNNTYLQFQGAQIVYRELLPNTDLTYFTGRSDRFASGELFLDYFGAAPLATRFQGYLYFPENEYRGIHTVNGTGVELSSSFGSEWNRTSLYFYQDGYLGTGRYSADLDFAADLGDLKVESFVGGSFPVGSYGLYRGGLLFHYRPSDRGEFFAQLGVPYWKPPDRLSIDNLYFLFEPRVHFDPLSILLTLFWHPQYYLMESTGDLGSADIHLNFMLGDPTRNPLTGGLETNFNLDTTSSFAQDFEIVTTPYLSAVTSGVIWNFMVNVQLVPFSLPDMVEGVIGVKAEF